MHKISDTFRRRHGFSLAEALASVMIGAMVLVAMLRVYAQADRSAASIRRGLDSSRLPSELLQRIAEDLDGIIASDPDTKITVENKFVNGYPAARLTIEKTIKDSKNRTQVFEKIVWQSAYDYFSDANGLTLFRSHSGMSLEDKLLDEKRADIEKEYPLVPICSGVTCFKIQVPRGEELLDRWLSLSLPPGLIVTASFAEPFQTVEGTLDVPEEDKITRTIAVDRTRKIKFEIVKRETEEEMGDQQEEAAAEEGEGAEETLGEDEAVLTEDKQTPEAQDAAGEATGRKGKTLESEKPDDEKRKFGQR
ncbi:MAG TPA: hypothetical protein VMX13_01680 [Sedimentisphaerales bacterium]|nr:hypothetical protein [Sedimentisphaerales bacterium]